MQQRREGASKAERYFIESSYSELYTRGIRREPLGKIKEEMIKKLSPLKGDIVLEVGTGEGRYMPLIIRDKAIYIGTDISKRILINAQDYLKPENKEHVHFVAAEAKHLPFKSKSISKSFCYATIFYVPNKGLAIDEMKRVSREKIVVEFRNIFSPKVLWHYVTGKLINVVLTRQLTRKLVLSSLKLVPYFRKHLWTKMATEDPKLALEPYFPDSPSTIQSYFDVPFKIYTVSPSKLQRNWAKQWCFKGAIIVEAEL